MICHDCGKAIVTPEATLRTGSGATGYSTWDGDKTVCYPCSDERTKRSLLNRSERQVLYLSSDGKHVTTWTDGVVGRVVKSWEIKHAGWHNSTQVYVRMTDVHGRDWYGRCAGRGMSIKLQATKR